MEQQKQIPDLRRVTIRGGDTEQVKRIHIQEHIGGPATPPPISPARSPPVGDAFDWDQTSTNAPEQGEPAPEFEYDQTVSW